MYAPEFNRTIEQPIAAGVAVPPDVRFVVTEGNYLLDDQDPWPQVRAEMDEVWYCEVSDELRRERLIARHIRFGKSPSAARAWVNEVDEPNALRIAAQRGRADWVLSIEHTDLGALHPAPLTPH